MSSQIIIFIATAFALLGSIGLWYFNGQVEDKKKEDEKSKRLLLEQRTRERDAAINQIQRTSTLIAELDNPVDRVDSNTKLDRNLLAEWKGITPINDETKNTQRDRNME